MSIWIAGHSLTEAQTLENAQYVLNDMLAAGWTKESVCGMLGNMKRESSVNPGLWENWPDLSGGYGLVQWTPSTNYSNWAVANGLPVENMDSQLAMIKHELADGGQWYATSGYQMTFLQFTQSTMEPGVLAEYFLKCYERAGVEALQERIDYARLCYTTLIGGTNAQPGYTPGKKQGTIKIMKRYYIRGIKR